MSSKGPGLPKDEIFHAIHNNNLELIKSFITPDHANLKDRSGYTLLHVATNNEKVDIAKWLVSIGADVNLHCNGHTVTSIALTKGNFELFDYYLNHNGDCKGRNQLNLLHEAANKNRADIVETLIAKGADPNQLNNMHHTPLTIAIGHKNTEICRILLENGACANLPDKKGNTSLHLACSQSDTSILNVLLESTECDLRLKNSNEETPLDLYWTTSLHKAIEPSTEMLDKLISAGAVFCNPWNMTLNMSNHVLFLKSMSHLSKYRLHDLFLNETPFYTDFVINGYWRNALIVSIKSAIIDFKSQSRLDDKEMFKLIETIVLSGQIRLSYNDLCSTLYMFDDVLDYPLAKSLKALFSSPLKLKHLARIECRHSLIRIDKETVNQLTTLSDELKSFLLFQEVTSHEFNMRAAITNGKPETPKAKTFSRNKSSIESISNKLLGGIKSNDGLGLLDASISKLNEKKSSKTISSGDYIDVKEDLRHTTNRSIKKMRK